MFNVPQWVTWEPVQYPGEPKARKIPCGGGDAHNPANWSTFLDVSARSQNIGFVLTDKDPYFCIDIDHCLTPDNQWSELALTVLAMFPGAYIEISFSGDGLHVFGHGVMPDGFKHKNSALGLEVYDRLRYIAITQHGKQGNPDLNHQGALNQFVQTYMETAITVTGAGWTTTPRVDWNGPDDDNELIRRMLEARPSANSLWGGAASIVDLWNNNTAVFKECYPDNSELGYDQSSPDMALASHLAFWTGCNCERIERIMWMSGLRREKWTSHPTYLRDFTITKAAGACRNVYNDPRAANPVAVQPLQVTGAPVDPTQGQARQGHQIMYVDAQLEHFKGCVYVINTHRVWMPNGTLLSPEQFKVVMGGFKFAMDNINEKTTKCAWEVFSKSQAVNFPIVDGVLFRPEHQPNAIIEQDNMKYLNTWTPVNVRTMEGDATPFLDLMYKLFPDNRDRTIILSYMAACIQHVGVKFQWCPLIQGTEGNGKSFLMRALIYAIGEKHSHLVNPKDIGNKFNAWLEGRVFAGIEEVHVSDRRDLIDVLKIMITNDRIEIQPKGGDQYMGDNRVNFVMNTNYPDAIKKTKNDRRYCVFFTPHQTYEDMMNDGMGGDYFPNLYRWARADGYAITAHFLMNYAIPDEFNPATNCHRAPDTTSTMSAIKASQGPVEQEIENAVDEGRVGFRGGWVSAMALDKLLHETGKARVIHRNRRQELLESLGYVKVGRATMNIQGDGGRPMLYIKKELPKPIDFAFEYMTAQGFMVPDQNS